MWRQTMAGVLVGVAALTAAPAARAQDQSLVLNIGGFVPRGFDARADGDVLSADRCLNTVGSCEPLLFDMSDFNGFTFSGEWLVGLGEFFEAGGGVGFYQHTTHSVYENLTYDDGTEIEQDLKLRIVPITATVRFVPTGRHAAVQPYIGGGLGIFNWRYSEAGDFVDTGDGSIFRASYSKSGTNFGPVAFGGVKFRVTRSVLLGGEVRYQKAEGTDLPDGFLGDRIDLSGFTYSGLVQFRF